MQFVGVACRSARVVDVVDAVDVVDVVGVVDVVDVFGVVGVVNVAGVVGVAGVAGAADVVGAADAAGAARSRSVCPGSVPFLVLYWKCKIIFKFLKYVMSRRNKRYFVTNKSQFCLCLYNK